MSNTQSVGCFFKDLRKHGKKTYSKEEEHKLIKLAQEGDSLSVDKLAKANLKYVVTLANKYKGNNIPLEDLISSGNQGIMYAIETFDLKQDVCFGTWLVQWVRKCIVDEIMDNSRTVRIPKWEYDRYKELEKQKNEDLLDGLFINVDETLGHCQLQSISLNRPSNFLDDSSEDLINTIKSNYNVFNGIKIEESSFEDQYGYDIKDTLKILTDKEKDVICFYFGFNSYSEIANFDEISIKMNLSLERTRQIYRSAIRKIRCYMVEHSLVNQK